MVSTEKLSQSNVLKKYIPWLFRKEIKNSPMHLQPAIILNIGVNNGESSDAFAQIGNHLIVCDVEGSGNGHNGALGADWALDRIHNIHQVPINVAYIDLLLKEHHLILEANENGLVGAIELSDDNTLIIRTLFHRLEAIDPDHPTDVKYFSSTDSDHTGADRLFDVQQIQLRQYLQKIKSGEIVVQKINTSQLLKKNTIAVFAATDGLMKSMTHGIQHFADPLDFFRQPEVRLSSEFNHIWDANGRDVSTFFKEGIPKWYEKRKELAESNPKSIHDDLLIAICPIKK